MTHPKYKSILKILEVLWLVFFFYIAYSFSLGYCIQLLKINAHIKKDFFSYLLCERGLFIMIYMIGGYLYFRYALGFKIEWEWYKSKKKYAMGFLILLLSCFASLVCVVFLHFIFTHYFYLYYSKMLQIFSNEKNILKELLEEKNSLFFIYLINATLLTSISEEFFYRGLVQGYLSKNLPLWLDSKIASRLSIFLSICFFIFVHGPVFYFILFPAVCFVLMYHYFGFFFSVLAHCIYNSFILYIYLKF